jgi:hypothetical protein
MDANPCRTVGSLAGITGQPRSTSVQRSSILYRWAGCDHRPPIIRKECHCFLGASTYCPRRLPAVLPGLAPPPDPSIPDAIRSLRTITRCRVGP